ncbi:hypothetical protein KUTeg_020428 [Tegillarca granosa]|uniref:Trichohyalin-like n=1 Tax=Tegillarca granosa TaxID=220873 RepID=A0ABQ9EAL3_TEGGR|nr:hypothetical protein KUTeg_020428 [Tegillarca granosa]
MTIQDETVEETPDGQSENKISPALQLWKRLEGEKINLQKRLKGLEDDYLGEKEQEIHLVRIRYEGSVFSLEENFVFAAIQVGLAERMSENGTPSLQGDQTRYIKLAKHQIEVLLTAPKSKEQSDQLVKGKDKVAQMEGITESMKRKHRHELELFTKLLHDPVDQSLQDEVMSLSQQQRKDRLFELKSFRYSMPLENWQVQERVIREGIIIKREIYRHRLNQNQKENVGDKTINEMLFADLLKQQNCDAEKMFTLFINSSIDELVNTQQKQIQERKCCMIENVAIVIFTPETTGEDSETELLEALDGKFDALRDKLLAEALMRQLGESEWNRLSDLERQKKLTELKLKEKQLRREGRLDELAEILGDALQYDETLKKLLGDSKEEQERKLRERLARRKQRLAQGMTEEECDKLEQEDIAKEEEEEKKRHKNILLELQHHYEKEKEELLRRLRNESDRQEQERKRQIEVMKLKKQERKARKEEKFNSAALVIGLAEEHEKNRQELQDEEINRQKRLAQERIQAARNRRKGDKSPDTEKEDQNLETEDKSALQEMMSSALDKRHKLERDILMEMLDNGCDTPSYDLAKQMSEEERQDKLSELQELRKLWRQNGNRDKNDQLDIFKESVGYQIESQLHKAQEEGKTKSVEEVKVQILTDLQLKQDEENRKLLSGLEEKDADTLKQMIKAENLTHDQGNHDNVSSVLLGVSDIDKSDEDGSENKEVVQALEEKYDALRDKILEATLIQDIGEDEWNKLSDKEKQMKLVELKMKEKKLRKDGKLKEAADMFKNLLKNGEALEKILGDTDTTEEEDPEERKKKKEQLKQEREEQGLSVDDETLDQILDEEAKEEAKKKRKNILENLQMMFDDEKAALLAQLKGQKDRAVSERERQIAIAKLRRDKKRLEKEEKLDSAALILSLAKEADSKQKENIAADRERQIALAKERLEARRKKRMSPENLEDKLRNDIESEKLQDIQNLEGQSAVHVAVFEALEKRQENERDLLMELFLMAKTDQALTKSAKQKNPEELKMELSKLEQDRTKWRNKSQQLAVNTDVESLSPKECNVYFKQVSDSRQEQVQILKKALVNRLELEERHLMTQNPDMSPEELVKELQVSLLADLQEKQTLENNAIQNIIKQKDNEDLQKLKKVQRMATREGWYDCLAGMLFQISHGDEDFEEDETIARLRKDMEQQIQDEKDELINQQTEPESKVRRAARLGEDIDMEAELRNIENQMEAKKKVIYISPLSSVSDWC